MPHRPRKAKPIKQADAPKERGTTAERGYGTLHRKLRDQLLDTYPVCQLCQAAFSAHAHHTKYPAESLADYLALCEQCHMNLHREENQSR